MAKKQIKTAAIAVPSTQAEAEKLLADIGRLQRQMVRIEADMNDHIAGIKDKHEKLAQPVNEEIESKFQALHAWAEAHRGELLKGKAKTAQLSTGELQWRITPPAVKFRRGAKVEAIVEQLEAAKLFDLVRTVKEVNKEMILADPERVAGIGSIEIKQREEFVAKPFESQIERAEPVKKTAKAAA
jgi:phage host-nuclease inhibitor protein Gam